MRLFSWPRFIALAFSLICASIFRAEVAPKAVIPLWPEGVPGLKADASEERLVNDRVTNVHRPTLLYFPPAPEKANGAAVVFCPGGGYIRLAIRPDGLEQRSLSEMGVAVFVLKYRMVEYGFPAPLQDVLRAVRLVRSRAAEFGLQPDRVGVWGASAGGHVAGMASLMWDAPEGQTGSDLDKVSARPDFSVLIYPVVTMSDPFVHKGSREGLLGKSPTAELIERLSLEKHVRKDAPPMFVVATMADKTVPVENSLLLYQALRNAGVPAELHVYGQGSHASSVDPKYGPTALWPKRMEEWMSFNGILGTRN